MFRTTREFLQVVNTRGFEHRAIAEKGRVAIDATANTFPRYRLEVIRAGRCDAPFACSRDNRCGQRMLALLLQRSCEAKDFAFRGTGRWLNCDQLRFAIGECTGLVHGERIDLLHPLQHVGGTDQDTERRTAADPHHHGHWRRETQRARTRDDEHRDGADEPRMPARRWSERRPHRERDEPGPAPPREPRGHPVRELLCGRTTRCASATG